MKLIIAGGREFADHELFWRSITDWVAAHGMPSEVVTGGASGADTLGHEWATREQIPTRVFRADWGLHGRRAGPLRNGRMVGYVGAEGALLALPGGRGTQDMVGQARRCGLHITEVCL